MDNLSYNQSAAIPRNNFFDLLFPINLSVSDNFQLANEYINKDLNIYSAVSQQTPNEMDTLISQSTVAQQTPTVVEVTTAATTMTPAVKVNNGKLNVVVPRKRKLQDVVDNIVEQTILADTEQVTDKIIVSQEPAVAMNSSVIEEEKVVAPVAKPIAKKRKPAVKKLQVTTTAAEPMETSSTEDAAADTLVVETATSQEAAVVPETIIKEKKSRKSAVRKTSKPAAVAQEGENVATTAAASSSDDSTTTPVTKPKRKSVKKSKTDEVVVAAEVTTATDDDQQQKQPIAKKRKISSGAKKDTEKTVKRTTSTHLAAASDSTKLPPQTEGEHIYLTYDVGNESVVVVRRLQMKRTLAYTLKIDIADHPIIFIPQFSKKFNMLFSFCPILNHMVATVHVLEDCYLEIGQVCASS